jgi:hypothetical protein
MKVGAQNRGYCWRCSINNVTASDQILVEILRMELQGGKLLDGATDQFLEEECACWRKECMCRHLSSMNFTFLSLTLCADLLTAAKDPTST